MNVGVDGGLCYVAIKGQVFDVTGNKVEDVSPEWADLPDNEKKVPDDWFTLFSKQYNIVGVVECATNM